MKRDYLMPKDMYRFCQEFDTPKQAAKMCRMVKRVCKDVDVHVRKGRRIVVSTRFSSNAWALTFTTLLSQLQKRRIVEPEWIWKYANECSYYAEHRMPWYLIDKDYNRVSCYEFLTHFSGLTGMKYINQF